MNKQTINRNPLLNYWFGMMDSRAIAAFRIFFSIFLLKDAVYHLFLAKWFYSDVGIVPRQALFDGLVRSNRFSFMDAIGQDWLAILFFVVWIGVLICLLIGYRVRVMAVVNFIMILSIHERNGFILTGADTALRVFAFWMMFAPIGQHYSIDALRRKSLPEMAFALPARMLQLQLVIIYATTLYLKTLEPVWTNGEALFYVLQLDSILLPPGAFLRTFPEWVLIALTHYTMIAETLIPILLLFPIRKWFIALAFGLAILLHGGIAMALAIPDFSIVMLIAFIPHFPASWFDKVDEYLFRILRKNHRIRKVLRWIVNRTPQPPTLLRRYRLVSSLVLIPLMGLVIWWNAIEATAYAEDYGYTALKPMPEPIENIIWYSGLWQWWDLFAPLPLQYDGFIIIPGVFENGISFDLRTRKPTPDRELFPRFGPWMRFEKLEENAERYEDQPLLLAWGRYYCRLYNTEMGRVEGTRLETLDIIFTYRNSHKPGEEANPYQQYRLWRHWCLR